MTLSTNFGLCIGFCLAALIGTGCGGESAGAPGGGSCGGEACGGDVVGHWELESTCVRTNGSVPGWPTECSGAIMSIQLEAHVSFDFEADGTFRSQGTSTVFEHLRFDQACYGAIGGKGSLDEAGCASMQESGDGAVVDCQLSGAVCDCTAQLGPNTISNVGSYEVSNHVLTRHEEGGEVSATDYCVRDKVLTLTASEDGSTSSMTMRRQ